MIDEYICIYEYELILMEQIKRFQLAFKGSPVENQKAVGVIWRYAVEKMLGWTPEAAVKNMDSKLVEDLLLDRTFVGIGFDKAHSYVSDYAFVLQYAFPEKIRYDFYAETIAEYEKFAKIGPWSGDETNYRHPKFFFTRDNDGSGVKRAHICLRYAMDLYIGDMNTKDRYIMFANPSEGRKWLRRRSLTRPLELIYNSPLDYFHNSLPGKEKDEFLYNALKIKNAY